MTIFFLFFILGCCHFVRSCFNKPQHGGENSEGGGIEIVEIFLALSGLIIFEVCILDISGSDRVGFGETL